MVGWHHRLNGNEFEQTPRESEGQGRLACCSPGGCKEPDMTQRVNNRHDSKHFPRYTFTNPLTIYEVVIPL